MKLLSDIKIPKAPVHCQSLDRRSVLCFIDNFYTDLINVLQISSDSTVPSNSRVTDLWTLVTRPGSSGAI